MKLRQWKILSLILFLLLPVLSYADTTEKFQFTRPDGSTLVGYYSPPYDTTKPFPVGLIIHGSQCESISVWHEDFRSLVIDFGAALITIEKQGIYSPTEIDLYEYDMTNCLDHRLEDHLLLIEKLREGLIPGWNGRIIMIGGSEGGRIAAAISAQTPEIKATVLFTSGGGLNSVEELQIAFTKYLKSRGESDEEIAETLMFLDHQIIEMLTDPTPGKIFLSYTYKWWASHLSRHVINDLINIDHPIFYAHGTHDTVVPIESAEKVVEIFQELGKTNMTYRRVEGYDHDMRTFPFWVTLDMLQLLESVRSEFFP